MKDKQYKACDKHFFAWSERKDCDICNLERQLKEAQKIINTLDKQLSEVKAENERVAKECRWYSDRNQEHIATIASLRDGLRLILPMAKSYAERHPWGNNLSFIAEVEALLKEGE